MKKILLTACSTILLFTGASSYALNLGNDITVFDGNIKQYTSNEWWKNTNEDQEVEPHMTARQNWDLEGFFLNGLDLSLVGGFDFINGAPGYPQFGSGNIFISIDDNFGTAQNINTPSPLNEFQEVNDNFGYEFAIKLDFYDFTYSVYELQSDSLVKTVYYLLNEITQPSSDPYLYLSGGVLKSAGNNFTYQKDMDDDDVGFLGGDHNVISGIDISFLTTLNSYTDESVFTFHFTMGCGNDNLMGQSPLNPVPEPATLFLFGTGLAGFAGLVRRNFL